MPGPELNLDSFDLVDLWQQTDILAAGLKDRVYVSEFWGSGTEINANLGWDVKDKARRIRLENAQLELNTSEVTTFTQQIRSAIANPRYSVMQNLEPKTHDDAPELSPQPDIQLAVAQRFLPKLSRIALDAAVITDAKQPRLIANRNGESNRDNVLQLARINLGIATLLGYETDRYKEIAKRAEVWSPQTTKKLDWL